MRLFQHIPIPHRPDTREVINSCNCLCIIYHNSFRKSSLKSRIPVIVSLDLHKIIHFSQTSLIYSFSKYLLSVYTKARHLPDLYQTPSFGRAGTLSLLLCLPSSVPILSWLFEADADDTIAVWAFSSTCLSARIAVCFFHVGLSVTVWARFWLQFCQFKDFTSLCLIWLC